MPVCLVNWFVCHVEQQTFNCFVLVAASQHGQFSALGEYETFNLWVSVTSSVAYCGVCTNNYFIILYSVSLLLKGGEKYSDVVFILCICSVFRDFTAKMNRLQSIFGF
jgi:hypothetical protein